ncbi:MAG: hypothetical protein KAI55_05050 [Candidatus Aenigmarchaeota archaeon]|nr:hypothetical protein [Candidatus Aenigmarchaeota archaeon]
MINVNEFTSILPIKKYEKNMFMIPYKNVKIIPIVKKAILFAGKKRKNNVIDMYPKIGNNISSALC